MSTFSDRLISAREHCGLTQKKLAELLNITPTRLNYWEKGKREPDVMMIKNISRILKISPDYLIGLDDNFAKLKTNSYINKYNSLDDISLATVNNVIDFEYEQSQKRKSEKIIDINTIEAYPHVPYYDVPASAGTGRYLDYSTMQIVTVNDDVPQNADYILKVAGDSMEPKFSDGDYVYVSKSSSMSFGDIGIFYFDNNVYIKKYMADGLKSLNPAYQLIPQREDISCLGKVIGKVCGDIHFE